MSYVYVQNAETVWTEYVHNYILYYFKIFSIVLFINRGLWF